MLRSIIPFTPEIFLGFSLSVFVVFYMWYYRHTRTLNPDNSVNRFFDKVPYTVAALILFMTLLISLRLEYLESTITSVSKSVGCWWFENLIILLSMIILYMSCRSNKSFTVNPFLFCIIILFNTLCICGTAIATASFCIYLALEFQQIGLIILCASRFKSDKGIESALKYIILGILSGAILLLGITFVYLGSGALSMSDITAYVTEGANAPANSLDSWGVNVTRIGTFLVITSFCFKLYSAPFHIWISDIYNSAPRSVTFYLCTVYYLATIYVFLRFYGVLILNVTYGYDWIFTSLGIFSIITGVIGAALQSRIRRFIAYSSIMHSGYLFIALGTHSLPIIGSCWNMCCWYTITLFGVFVILVNFLPMEHLYTRGKWLIVETWEDLADVCFSHKETIPALGALLFSIGGFPPLGGFVWKLVFLLALAKGHHWNIIAIVLVVSLLNMYIYAQIIKMVWAPRDINWEPSIPAMSMYGIPMSALIVALFIVIHNICVLYCPGVYTLILTEMFLSAFSLDSPNWPGI